MAKPHLKVVSPTTVNRTVIPRRRRNGDLRTREYLTEHEVERLIETAKRNRHGHRDTTARPTGGRAGGLTLGSGRFQNGDPARPQSQAGHS